MAEYPFHRQGDRVQSGLTVVDTSGNGRSKRDAGTSLATSSITQPTRSASTARASFDSFQTEPSACAWPAGSNYFGLYERNRDTILRHHPVLIEVIMSRSRNFLVPFSLAAGATAVLHRVVDPTGPRESIGVCQQYRRFVVASDPAVERRRRSRAMIAVNGLELHTVIAGPTRRAAGGAAARLPGKLVYVAQPDHVSGERGLSRGRARSARLQPQRQAAGRAQLSGRGVDRATSKN